MIRIEGISKKYNGETVLDNITRTFESHQIYGLMGPSGTGKTTLLHVLCGLVKPDAGNVDIAPDARFGVVFQEDRLCESFSAIENVRMVCSKHISADTVRNELRQLLPDESLDKPVRKLSGGMRRRVAICRAIMAENDYLIMDEPFSGLDNSTKNQTIHYILKNRKDRMLIISTHNADDIKEMNGLTVLIGG